MGIAIDGQDNWRCGIAQGLPPLVKDDFSGAIKAYQDFQKAKEDRTSWRCHGRSSLEKNDVKALGDLPSKEELMAQIAGALNALANSCGYQRGSLRWVAA